MARTIGKKNTRIVKYLTRKAIKQDLDDIRGYVHEELPITVYDTWESAYDEIECIINDTIWEKQNESKCT